MFNKFIEWLKRPFNRSEAESIDFSVDFDDINDHCDSSCCSAKKKKQSKNKTSKRTKK